MEVSLSLWERDGTLIRPFGPSFSQREKDTSR